MFEHRLQPPIPRRAFVGRLVKQALHAAALVAVSVLLGMVGYHWIAGFTWVDAFLNASMILGGMGPVGELPNDASKVFAGFFALYSGLVFIGVVVLVLMPVIHRVLHRFHWERNAHDSR